MVKPSVLRVRDLLDESVASILQRPGRSILTMLGTLLGIGAFVAILGLTTTAAGQIDKRFTALAATEVMVEDVASGTGGPPQISFPPNAAGRALAVDGVVAAGVFWTVPLRSPTVAGAPGVHASASTALAISAADSGALAAMRPTLLGGRIFDSFHEKRRDRVAVLGSAAARQLGISRLDAHPAVFINDTAYTVIGIVADFQRNPELLLSVIIPSSTALAAYGAPEMPSKMLVEVRVGAGEVVAQQLPYALRPDAPQRLRAIAPPNPQSLRGTVTEDFNALFLLLAAISLVIGAVGIANTTFVSVLERTGEIGLRRSLGAKPVHILMQFLTESAAIGGLGGLTGASLGVAVTVSVAVIQDWTAVLDPWTVIPAPLFGTLVGLLAGLYPASRAAKVQPVEALRR